MVIDRQRLLLYAAENAGLSSSGVRSCCGCLSNLITCLLACALIKHQWGTACKRRWLLLKISISRSPITASTDVKTLCYCLRRFPLVVGARVQPKGHKRIWEIYKVCGLITHQPTFCASISLFPPPLLVPSLCLAVSQLLTSLVSLWPLNPSLAKLHIPNWNHGLWNCGISLWLIKLINTGWMVSCATVNNKDIILIT